MSKFPLQTAGRRGAALVIVLATLVLITALVVAFFSSVTTERSSAASYSQGSNARKLAETALNLVVAQIKDATNGTDASGLPAPWASQPGVIRTFNRNGTEATAYKLYSAPALRDSTGGYNPAATDLPPADWYSSPALYADINSPVPVPSQSGGGGTALEYPVLDPAAGEGIDSIGVKGFSLDGAPVQPSGAANAAPMPVQWLYVLENGQITSATGSGNSAAMRDATPTAANPIVGRVAFWTDDESCKVNLNTAAGDLWEDTGVPGSFADTPYPGGGIEGMLRANQPIIHEYQRYPGHPATTYLSAVFSNVINGDRNTIYNIAPKVTYHNGNYVDISSQGGTRSTVTGTQATLPLADKDHLYASVDELRFAIEGSKLASGARARNLFTARQVKEAAFFATALSRAPDLNLYGKPRISMWPQTVNASGASLGTPFDRTIAFCSTIGAGSGSDPYYFVRHDSRSATYDYQNFARNQQLYKYLQDLTGNTVPGFGGDFLAKYGADRDQILTEIYDYIRSCVNLLDAATGATPYASKTAVNTGINVRELPSGTGQVIPIQIGDTRGFGRVHMPSFPTIHFVGIEAKVDPAADLNGDGIIEGTKAGEKASLAKLYTTKLQAAILFDNFAPATGPARFIPDLVYEMEGLDQFTLDGKPMNFPPKCGTSFNRLSPNHEYAWGGPTSPGNLFWNKGSTVPKKLDQTETGYGFYSAPLEFPMPQVQFRQAMSFTGGEVTLNIYAVGQDGKRGTDPIQTIKLNFEDTVIPAPTVHRAYQEGYAPNPSPVVRNRTVADYLDGRTLDAPGPIAPNFSFQDWVNRILYDVTRGVVPYHGDYRLALAQKVVEKDAKGNWVYGPGRGYKTVAADLTTQYGFKTEVVDATTGAPRYEEKSGGSAGGAAPRSCNYAGTYVTSGVLVPGAQHEYWRVNASFGGKYHRGPAVPSIIDGVTRSASLTGLDGNLYPGDWDTGMTAVPDGPYINKADEGDRGSSAYSSHNATLATPTIFSPNRQVPSPVILGSLSTGVKAAKPWQTLLFAPNPPAKDQHPGLAAPHDHLLLDLFTMPVVEPYAISEPFSTAGKVNLNYQIAPFPYIERSTALQAVLRSTRLSAIPTADADRYKTESGAKPSEEYRKSIDLELTLRGFEERFAANRPFRSPSEICQIYLVPQGVSIPVGVTVASVMRNWWDTYGLTGDNLREKPYAQVYSRLTTRSNIYTAHVWVQALKKRRDTPANTWQEGKDQVVGEYRGHYTIERYIDPNDPDIQTAFDESFFQPDVLDANGRVTKTGRLEPFYKYRVVSTKQFAP